jgi:PAS domain S-box-containing protein
MHLTTGTPIADADAHRFELLVDAIADYAIYMLDPDGFITSWNAGAERIKGYRSREIVGQHFSRFFTPEDQREGVPEFILSSARSSGRHEAEGERVRKDGTRFWANAIIQTVRDERGKLIGFAKITRDITERVEAQNALRESERRFRLLAEGVVDYAIYMLDPSGVVMNWNAGAERLKGYAADEIVGQHFSRFYSKEDRASCLPGRVLAIAEREGRYETEGWRLRKDGSRFWASIVVDVIRDPSGKLEGFAKVTRDITERRAALEALQESERQFRLLVAGVTDYAIYMLDLNGIVTSWNAGAQRIKGYAADEIIGQHFSRFYTERERSAGVPSRALHTALQNGRFETEGWRCRKDGTMFWANVVIDPIRDEQGELIGFAKITRDITERRDAQAALQDAQTQRAHAQKMDALGQLTGGVAHDFNNLLMVVTGHVQTVKKALADNPKAARAAEAIEIAAQRGVSLTRQLLTFSRRQTVHPTVVNVGERAEALRILLASTIGPQVTLTATVGPDIWPVKVDSSELELSLVNLSLNAKDAMPDGGIIAITAENVTLGCKDTPSGIVGEFVALRISDTGSGIAPDVLPKVFDPFFTTKGMDKGTGLGLSQVHGFAHQSGGSVTVQSELGRGTTVTVYLPRALALADEPTIESAEEAVGGELVLVVEDNPDVAEVSSSMLVQLGYRVRTVTSAQAALEAVDERDFDLVVSDIIMPGTMNGLDLARAIRERKPNLPVLLVTGYSHASADASREFIVMRKPFDVPDLSRAAARLIASAKQPETTNLVRLSDVRGHIAAKAAEE